MKRWVLASLFAAVLMLLTLPEASSSRILFISPIASKSHTGFFNGIIDKLADSGHHVTVVSSYRRSKPKDNVREILLEDINLSKLLPNPFDGQMSAMISVMGYIPKLCSDALGKKEIQHLFQEEFDLGFLSVVFSDCFLSVFHRMGIPYNLVCPNVLSGPMGPMIGNPSFPSFAHNPFGVSVHPFTFVERLQNTIIDTAMSLVTDYWTIPNIDAECRRRGLCPETMPNLSILRRNASLLFVNSVRTLEYPARPAVPSAVHLGGIHCQEAKPLPKDLEDWVAGAGDDGFIFFSLGSVVQPSTMPEKYRKTLLKVFGSLKQRVLWKWNEDTMEGLPPNVRLGKWLPQQDILGDPRLRVFITHGGLLSTQESIYHGRPVIGLPVIGDQKSNMMEVQHQGWGRVLLWEDLTPEKLKEMIHLVMTDEKLRDEVKRKSAVMRDQLNSPAELAKYWTEYVLRHNGARHLQSPIVSMSWYQVYNVDVWLTVIGSALLVLYLLLKLLLALCRCFCVSRSKTKRD